MGNAPSAVMHWNNTKAKTERKQRHEQKSLVDRVDGWAQIRVQIQTVGPALAKRRQQSRLVGCGRKKKKKLAGKTTADAWYGIILTR